MTGNCCGQWWIGHVAVCGSAFCTGVHHTLLKSNPRGYLLYYTFGFVLIRA